MTTLRSFLEPVIRRQRQWRKWRMLAWCWGLLATAAGLALILSTNLALPANTVVERLVLVLVGGSLAVLFFNLRKRDVDYRQAARDIEEKHPELHAALLTAVEQKPDPKTGQFNFLQERVIAKAAEAFEQTSFANAVPVSQLNTLRSCSCGLLLLAGIMIYQIPSVTALPAQAQAQENAEDEPGQSKGAQLVKIDPGDAEIERGSRLPVLAHFSEAVPDKVFALLTPRDGAPRRIPLYQTLKDPIFGATLPNLDGPFTYQVEYDEQKSEVFSVEVFEYPLLVQADATLTYPAYTKLPQRTVKDTRRLTVVEGTQLAYKFHLNKPVASARLVGKQDEDTVELVAHPEQPMALLPPLTLTKTRKWKLELMDEAGRRN
ncbi:MAG: hypothetical protein VCA36_12930, partial [Opitutales bacterium]